VGRAITPAPPVHSLWWRELLAEPLRARAFAMTIKAEQE
jgi:hypothetical protein